MHDQSHQPLGTAGAEGCAPPLPAPRELGGTSCIPKLLLVRSHPAPKQAEGEEAEERKSHCKAPASSLSPGQHPVAPASGHGGRGGITPGSWVLRGGGCRHPVQRQSLDKANKNELKNSGRPQTGRFATQNWPVALGAGGRCWPLGAARMSLGTGTLS